MKNLFILKDILQDKNISDEAFTVWCGLRNIMIKDVTEYFVSFNSIACSVFNRIPNRYELEAMKKGYTELKDKEYIKELLAFSKTEFKVDLSALYFEQGQGFFSDLSAEEMNKIMSIDCGRHSKYKLLRYFACQVGSFNKSKDMSYYKGKIGGMSLDYFSELIPITKPTCIAFNEILEENELLFVIRHKDFLQGVKYNGVSDIREIPNTYSRWEDQEMAQAYAERTHGYKYFVEQEKQKTVIANKNRGLAQKLKHFRAGREYDLETIKQLYVYAEGKNKLCEDPADEIDMNIFDDYLLDFQDDEWGEDNE